MERENQIYEVQVEEIIPNRFQPRLNFDDKALDELSASIKEHGIIQPLVLRRLGNKYEIIAGERRYKAAIMAGLATVPAIVSNVDDNKSAEVAIVENLQRKNLTSIEEAISYRNLLGRGYITQEQLAQKLGISQSSIANKLRLLNLPDEVQKALMEEKISERHARSLLNVSNKETQLILLSRIISERMTVRQLDNEIKIINGVDVPQAEILSNLEETIPKRNEELNMNDNLMNSQLNVNGVNIDPNLMQNGLNTAIVAAPLPDMLNPAQNFEQPQSVEPVLTTIFNEQPTPNFQVEPVQSMQNVQVDSVQQMNTEMPINNLAEPTFNPTLAEFGTINQAPIMNNQSQNFDQTVPAPEPISSVSMYEDFKQNDLSINPNPNNKFFNFLEDESADLSATNIDPNAMSFDNGLNNQINNGVETLAPNGSQNLFEPAQPSVNLVDPAEMINHLDPTYVEPEKNNVVGYYQLNDIINDIRKTKSNIESKGFIINMDELDLETAYQFIITVNKE